MGGARLTVRDARRGEPRLAGGAGRAASSAPEIDVRGRGAPGCPGG